MSRKGNNKTQILNIKSVPKIGRNYSAKTTLASSGVEDFLLAFGSPLGYEKGGQFFVLCNVEGSWVERLVWSCY